MSVNTSGIPSYIHPTPTPSPRQLKWQKLERYAFAHFGPNAFTGIEWGLGNEKPSVFNPTNLDCRQWTRVLKETGFEAVIVTAKHHDGFCLWPSKHSTHTVAQSKWRDGKGDVLRDLAEACEADGLKLGVYLSPWDRNHPAYGTPEYNKVFADALTEVLTQYGPIFEVWFDGANGEGPNGRKQVYDWPLFVSVVREHQPDAVIFSDAGPDIRWVGNENGYAGETNWCRINRDEFYPGIPCFAPLTEGNPQGVDWVPAECDVSIRPGWFWRESENHKVKSVAQLLDIYYGSVGRGSSLLLNVPPDNTGQLHAADVTRLREFHRALRTEFSNPLEHTSEAKGSAECSLTLEFQTQVTFDRIMLREEMELGQRISKFEVAVEGEGAWLAVAEGTTIGRKRLLRIDPTTASRVRVSILESDGPAVLKEFRVFGRP